MPPSRARRSTFAIFALNGFLLGMWVVNIPEIRDRTGASTAVLGYLLLLLGGAALIGMQAGGRLIDRFGSRVVVVVASLGAERVPHRPGTRDQHAALAVALGLLGAFNGVIDVAQNAQAVEVERAYGRPIISGVPRVLLLGRAARLAGRRRADRPRHRRPADPRRRRRPRHPRHVRRPARTAPTVAGHDPRVRHPRARAPWTLRVVILSLLAFMLLLSEGVAYDWSTVHLHDSLGASKTVAAWAFGAFSVTMTLVRLVADRVVARIGAAAYVQRAALVGRGRPARGGAGAQRRRRDRRVGRVRRGPGRLRAAVLQRGRQHRPVRGRHLPGPGHRHGLPRPAGRPAVIGILTNWVSLTTAFAVPIVGCLVAGLLAPSALRKDEAKA